MTARRLGPAPETRPCPPCRPPCRFAAACAAALLSLSAAASEHAPAAPAAGRQGVRRSRRTTRAARRPLSRTRPAEDAEDRRGRCATRSTCCASAWRRSSARARAETANPNVVRVVSKAERAACAAGSHEQRRPRTRAEPKRAASRAARPTHHAAHWDYTGTRRPRDLGPDEARVLEVLHRHAPEPDRHPRRHPRRARPGALRLQAERLPRDRQRPHGAGQRRRRATRSR